MLAARNERAELALEARAKLLEGDVERAVLRGAAQAVQALRSELAQSNGRVCVPVYGRAQAQAARRAPSSDAALARTTKASASMGAPSAGSSRTSDTYGIWPCTASAGGEEGAAV